MESRENGNNAGISFYGIQVKCQTNLRIWLLEKSTSTLRYVTNIIQSTREAAAESFIDTEKRSKNGCMCKVASEV
jgi:hypothetical protein